MFIATLGSVFFSLGFFLNFLYYVFSFFITSKFKYIFEYHKISSYLINILLICSFFLFILCFAYSDFSLYSVFINSHTAKSLIYKVGAAWGSHEGSMLFWLFILAIYNLFYHLSRRNIEDLVVYHFQSFFQLIMHGFVIITVNPFKHSDLTPNEGNGFNPLLQDYALLIHPPILYLGYAGNLVSFSIIVSSVFKKRDFWLIEAKKWVLIPWSFLTLGIGLGSWWSYRELGWGGFWAWDPVENVSLLPWLAGLTFIHLSFIKKRTHLVEFFLKLNGIFIFIFSLFATFIVRSGILTSIHAFATSDERGWYFLILLSFFSIIGVVSVTFFDQNASNPGKLKKNDEQLQGIKIIDNTIGYDTKIFIYSTFLFAITYLLIIFTIVIPIYLNLYRGEIVTLGEDFYRKSFSILFLPMLILLNIIPYLSNRILLLCRIVISVVISCILTFLLVKNRNLIILMNIFFINLVISSYLIDLIIKIVYKNKINFSSFLSHTGICFMVLGGIICTLHDSSTEKLMDIHYDNKIIINDYTAFLNKVEKIENSDFIGIKANFSIWYKNTELGSSYPEVKFYKIEQMQLPDSSSFYHNFSDIYLLVTGVDGDKNKIMVKMYYKKFVMFIWIGCSMIGLSGFIILLKNCFSKKHERVNEFNKKQSLLS